MGPVVGQLGTSLRTKQMAESLGAPASKVEQPSLARRGFLLLMQINGNRRRRPWNHRQEPTDGR